MIHRLWLALLSILLFSALYSWVASQWIEHEYPPIGQFIEVDGLRLHYVMQGQGDGPALLLVHGATSDAACWIRPYNHRDQGLAAFFAARGRRVFAVTFAHKHGCNLLQAQQLNLAIQRVRELTDARRVDVLAHSKGGVAARALASGVREPWMTPYKGDIRRLVLVGAPNAGIDYSFRHPVANLALVPEKVGFNAPMSAAKPRHRQIPGYARKPRR